GPHSKIHTQAPRIGGNASLSHRQLRATRRPAWGPLPHYPLTQTPLNTHASTRGPAPPAGVSLPSDYSPLTRMHHTVPLDTDRHSTPCARAKQTLANFFQQQDHHPSAEHWAALNDIFDTLQAMADDTCARRVWLSSCDPGAGKSQSIIHMTRALTEDT